MTTQADAPGTNIQPYLFFNGQCEEAFEFYRTALGAEEVMKMRFKEAPPQEGASQEGCSMPPGSENKIMHMTFRVGSTVILASDGRCTGKTNFDGFALSLTVPNDSEAKRLFTALSNGGQVEMPLTKTFFSSSFGMVQDRFGVSWMVYVAP
jgi:PhnB protein